MQGTHSTCTQHFKLSWRDHVPHKGRSNTPEQHVFRMRSCLHCQCNEGFCLFCRLLKTLPFEAIIWPYPCVPASASLVLAQQPICMSVGHVALAFELLCQLESCIHIPISTCRGIDPICTIILSQWGLVFIDQARMSCPVVAPKSSLPA